MGFFKKILKVTAGAFLGGFFGWTGLIIGTMVGLFGSKIKKWLTPDMPDKEALKIQRVGSDYPIPVIYGTRKAGAIVVDRIVTDAAGGLDNEFYHVFCVFCHGEIDGYTEFFFNGVSWNDPRWTKDGQRFYEYQIATGTPEQNPLTRGTVFSRWDPVNSHYRGLATAIFTFKQDKDSSIWNGEPQITAIIRGKKCLNLLTGVTEYTENPAWHLYDYVRSAVYGLGLADTDIDLPSFNAVATICDSAETAVVDTLVCQTVDGVYSCTGSPAETVNFKRFSHNNIIDTGRTLFDNVAEISNSFRGFFPDSDGRIKIAAEIEGSSVFSFNADNIVSSITSAQPGIKDRFNRVVVRFPNKLNKFEMDECFYPSVDDPLYAQWLTEDNGLNLEKTIAAEQTVYKAEALQLAEVALKSSRNSETVQFTADAPAIQCDVGDIIDITEENRGWIGKLFRIASIEYREDFLVNITAVQHDNAIYPWSDLDYSEIIGGTNLGDPANIPAPTDLIIVPDATLATRGTLTWNYGANAFVRRYLVVLTSGSTEIERAEVVGQAYVIPQIDTGTYTIEVRAISTIGATSPVAAITFTLAIPVPPTSITTIVGNFDITAIPVLAGIGLGTTFEFAIGDTTTIRGRGASIVFAGLSTNTEYTIYARTVNALGTSAWTSQTVTTTADATDIIDLIGEDIAATILPDVVGLLEPQLEDLVADMIDQVPTVAEVQEIIDGALAEIAQNNPEDPRIGIVETINNIFDNLETNNVVQENKVEVEQALQVVNAELTQLNDVDLPALSGDLAAANAEINTLKTVTIPALNAELDAAQGDIDDLNNVTLPALDAELNAAQAEIDTLNDVTIPNLNGELEAANTEIDTLRDVTIPALDSELAAAQAEIDTLTDVTLPALDAELTTAQGEIDTLKNTTIPGLNDELDAAFIELNTAKDDIAAISVDLAIVDSDIAGINARFPIKTADIDAAAITTAKIADAAIASGKLADAAVSAIKIATGAITEIKIATNAVTSDKINALAITSAKVADAAVVTAKIADSAISAGKIATGAVTNTKIGTGAITATKISDGAIETPKLAAGAITADKVAAGAIEANNIAAGAIVAGKVAAGAIEAGNIAAGAVTAGTIAAGAITATEIAAGAVTTSKLNAGAVTADTIASNAITSAKISAGAIIAEKMAANSVTAGAILAGSIETDKIAAGAIVAGKISAGAVETASIAAGAITTGTLAANAVTATKISAGAIEADKLAANSVTTLSLSALSITTAKIAANAVVADKIAANAVTAEKIVAGAITTEKMTANTINGDRITTNTLNAAKIVAGSITTDLMTVNTINGDRILVNTLNASKIVSGSITTDKMTADSINGDRITAGTLNATKITVGTITSDRMTVNTINGDRITANTLNASKIVAGSITTDRMTADTINGDRITTNTLNAAKIVAGSITTDRMTANTINGDRILVNTLNASKITAGTITTDKMTANTINGDRILVNTLSADKIVANSITSDKIATNAITTDKIAAGAIVADKIAASSITTSKLVVTGVGEALNTDPNTQDITAWSGSGLAITADANSPTGGKTLICTSPTQTILSTAVPIDRTRNYEFRMFVRASGSPLTYLTVAFYDAAGAVISAFSEGWPGSGTFNYFGLINQAAPSAWTEYRISFGPNETAKIPPAARFVSVGMLANYSPGATRLANVRLFQKKDADLIVDGAIVSSKILTGAVVADKLAANSVTAAKIQAGAIETDKLAANAITADKLSATAIDGKLITGALIRTADAAAGFRAAIGDPLLPIWYGNGVISSANGYFYVNDAGSVYAKNLVVDGLSVFQGAVTSTATITGGTMRTASSGYRAEVGSGTLPFWYGTGAKNEANGLFYVDSSGNVVAKNATLQNASIQGKLVTDNGTGIRTEIYDDGTYLVWIGSGAKTDANAIFFVKKDETGFISGEFFQGQIIESRTGTASSTTLSNLTAAAGAHNSIGNTVELNFGFSVACSVANPTFPNQTGRVLRAEVKVYDNTTLLETYNRTAQSVFDGMSTEWWIDFQGSIIGSYGAGVHYFAVTVVYSWVTVPTGTLFVQQNTANISTFENKLA